MNPKQVKQIIREELARIHAGISLMNDVKQGLKESKIKYNRNKMKSLVFNDKFLSQLSMSKKIDIESMFYTYVIGDPTLEKKYNQ